MTAELSQVKGLYTQLKHAEHEMDKYEALFTEAKALYRRHAEQLGEIFSALGLNELGMTDGRKLRLKTTYYGSAAQERLPEIQAYLEKQGSAHMIKPDKIDVTGISIEELPEELRASLRYKINTNTLKAFLSELAGKGELSDEVYDMFKVHCEHKVELA